MSEELRGPTDHNEFAQGADDGRVGLVAEFWDFLKHNKKWWLIPILVMIAILLLIVAFAGVGGAAPFIYPLF